MKRVPADVMRQAREIDPARLARVRGVFADIDETISTRGKLSAEAYGALWRLAEAGVALVPVTGRAAGWCDHIARFWPVEAVVGENGAFYFYHDGEKLRRRFLQSDAERAECRRRLDAIRAEALERVPGCAVASDQPYRECDLAIDFCEDVAPLGLEAARAILAIFERHGARARISSIHVNGWFGDYDKRTTARLCARERMGADVDSENEAFLFCGDSPNDAPLFDLFRLSVGVANVQPFLGMMESQPAFVTNAESGAGFVEVADMILAAKAGTST